MTSWLDRPIDRVGQRRAQRLAQRKRSYDRQRAGEARLATRAEVGIRQPEKTIVPVDRMADALRVRNMSHPTLVGELMGDPKPGRSALDRRT